MLRGDSDVIIEAKVTWTTSGARVPSWMLRSDAAAIRIAAVATLDVATLRALTELVRTTVVAAGEESDESRGRIGLRAPERAREDALEQMSVTITLDR